jgi:sigma-B regulation protein RsbU (phosphoserine phosphatase)
MSAPPPALSPVPELEGEPVVVLRVPARAESLRLVRGLVREAAMACGCGEDFRRDIVIAVDEACQNVIRHAYGDAAEGDIVIDVRRHGERLEVNVVDFAPPVDTARVGPRALDDLRPGGLGTHFIRECVDQCEFRPAPEGAGNRLWMAKKIE